MSKVILSLLRTYIQSFRFTSTFVYNELILFLIFTLMYIHFICETKFNNHLIAGKIIDSTLINIGFNS